MKDPTAEAALANIEREEKRKRIDPKHQANSAAYWNAKHIIEELERWQPQYPPTPTP